MANQAQLEILKQGVEIWNQWRKEHPDEKIDLSDAELCGAHLWGINLHGAYLRKADLQKASLRKADMGETYLSEANLFECSLSEANLRRSNISKSFLRRAGLIEADLRDVNLSDSNLIEAHLVGANLQKANLDNANLIEAKLSRADLHEASLNKAYMMKADFSEANLCGATLNEAGLCEANLSWANLNGAYLCRSDLSRANLSDAKLTRANLTQVNLIEARLVRTILTEATITSALLYGTSRDDWRIDGVRCDYVFWDDKPYLGKELELWQAWEVEHRMPQDRDFQPGEFERRYKQLPTFDYYFKEGFSPIDAIVMDRVVQAINERHPEFELKLTTLDSRGQSHATFTVLHIDHTKEALQQITMEYETRIQVLAAQRDELRNVLLQVIDRPQIVGQIINVGRDYIEHVDAHAQVITGMTIYGE